MCGSYAVMKLLDRHVIVWERSAEGGAQTDNSSRNKGGRKQIRMHENLLFQQVRIQSANIWVTSLSYASLLA